MSAGLLRLQRCGNRLDLFMIDAVEEEGGEADRHYFGDGESPPDRRQLAGAREQIGYRHQHHQLTHYRNYQAHKSMAQCLAYREGDDGETGEDEAEADRSERRHTDIKHGLGRFKKAQQLNREDPEDRQSDRAGI